MKALFSIIIFLSALGVKAQGQKSLQITYERFGKAKIFEVNINETLRYKLRGDFLFRKDMIVSFEDSLIDFDSDSTIKLGSLKAVSLRKNNHFISTLQFACLAGGVGFFSVNTINNLIGSRKPVFSDRVNYISAALVVSSALIRELNIKRIRLTKNKVVMIVERNYQDLNKPQAQPPEIKTGE